MDLETINPYEMCDTLANYAETVSKYFIGLPNQSLSNFFLKQDTPFSLEDHVEGIKYCFSQPTLLKIVEALDNYREGRGFFLADMADRIRSASPLAIHVKFFLLHCF